MQSPFLFDYTLESEVLPNLRLGGRVLLQAAPGMGKSYVMEVIARRLGPARCRPVRARRDRDARQIFLDWCVESENRDLLVDDVDRIWDDEVDRALSAVPLDRRNGLVLATTTPSRRLGSDDDAGVERVELNQFLHGSANLANFNQVWLDPWPPGWTTTRFLLAIERKLTAYADRVAALRAPGAPADVAAAVFAASGGHPALLNDAFRRALELLLLREAPPDDPLARAPLDLPLAQALADHLLATQAGVVRAALEWASRVEPRNLRHLGSLLSDAAYPLPADAREDLQHAGLVRRAAAPPHRPELVAPLVRETLLDTTVLIVADADAPESSGRVSARVDGVVQSVSLSGNAWRIVAALHERGRVVSAEQLAQLVDVSEGALRTALTRLDKQLQGGPFVGLVANVPRKGYVLRPVRG